MRTIVFYAAMGLLVLVRVAAAAESLQERLAAAKPGETIQLPSGEFTGGVTLPPGIHLKGASYGQTTIEAKGSAYGLRIQGENKTTISDLTIRGASKANLEIDHCQNVLISRVRVTEGTLGVHCVDCAHARLENSMADGNLIGIVLGDSRQCSVVNCTMACNRMFGLSMANCDRIVAFNNLMAGNEIGIFVGQNLQGATLDHNVYTGGVIGRVAGQGGRKHIGSWQQVSNYDRHSVHLDVAFDNADKSDFHIASILPWSLNLATVDGWGAKELKGTTAPTTDMDGTARSRGGVGAFESKPRPARAPDGRFAVQSDARSVSAGVFNAQGTLVCYLFQSLPLAKGTYDFHLPSRDFQGNEIVAGEYQVRVAEGNLDWRYLGKIGDNTAPEAPPARTSPREASKVAFGPDGQLFVANGWSEDTTNLRSYDVATGKILWTFGGQQHIDGLTVSPEDHLYLIKHDLNGKTLTLSRLDAKTGKPIAWKDGSIRQIDLGIAPGEGVAYWKGKLYTGSWEEMAPDAKTDSKADPARGRLRFGDAVTPAFTESAEVLRPSSPSVDSKTNVLWLISDHKTLLAVDEHGKTVATATPVERPLALCAREGRLAVASGKTGKVHIYDASDVKQLKEIQNVGLGDGPFGPWAVDRFQFQESALVKDPVMPDVALGPHGELAVGDGHRCLLFDQEGKYQWHAYGVFGGDPSFSFANPRRTWESGGQASYLLDESKDNLSQDNWQVEGFWRTPRGHVTTPVISDNLSMEGDFRDKDATFTVFQASTIKGSTIVICKASQFVHRPVCAFYFDAVKKAGMLVKDTNQDGQLTDADEPAPIQDGNPAVSSFDLWQFRCVNVCENGDLLSTGVGGKACVWKYQGLDSAGIPRYAMDPTTFAQPKDLKSPYSHQVPKLPMDWWDAVRDREKDTLFISMRGFDSKCDTGLAFSSSQDLLGFGLDGRLRWYLPLPDYNGCYMAEVAKNVLILGAYQTHDYLAVNSDGLILGTSGPAPESRYPGYWLDHVQSIRSYRGADGNQYMLVMDNYTGCTHWWRITGHERSSSHVDSLTVSADQAKSLAALPDVPLSQTIAGTIARRPVKIQQLPHALEIDGDFRKWRELGIHPQIVIPPRGDPREGSGLVRVAWEGKNLYFQVLQFDNEIAFGGMLHYLQDTFESCINGAMTGMKLDVAMLNGEPTLLRQKFYVKEGNFNLDQQHAPRVIKILDNAEAVSERELLEAVFGVDMSQCKVLLYEFKLPIDEITYNGVSQDLFPMKSGTRFWFGCAIDDCDVWGGNSIIQIQAPSTYSPWNPKETSLELELE